MKARNDMESIGYRSKGQTYPDGARAMCALMISIPLLQAMGLLSRNGEQRRAAINRFDDYLIIYAAPDGYAVNHKRPGSQGEINLAWDRMRSAPANASGKGRLPVKLRADGSLWVDITSWKRVKRNQDVLFEEQGEVLKP